MKTAVSIPDAIFRRADRLAKRLGISRSELYAKAVKRYLDAESDAEVTKKINDVYGPGGEDSSLDPVLVEMQARTLAMSKDEDE